MTAPGLEGFWPLAGAALLHALRLLPLALTSPLLGGPLLPPAGRLGLAFGLGGVAAWLAAPPPPASWPAACATEAALGLGLAVLAAAPLEAARGAGRLVDTFRGATLAELHVAPLRQRESAAGDLLAQLVLVLAGWAGGERLLVGGLLGSFATLPAGAPFAGAGLREAVLASSAALLSSAVALSLPAAAGVLCADLALAGASRVAPQLGAVNAAQPLRATLGLLALAGVAATAGGRLAGLLLAPLQLPLPAGGLP
ncbi:MAG: flagellar biosynthetic protein FliR [Anaeromyxobacter sp.]